MIKAIIQGGHMLVDVEKQQRMQKSMPRLLRTYQRIAWQDHDCWRCNRIISAGEEYIGKVFITLFTSGKRIVVQKEHLDCDFDPGFDIEECEYWLRYGAEEFHSEEEETGAMEAA